MFIVPVSIANLVDRTHSSILWRKWVFPFTLHKYKANILGVDLPPSSGKTSRIHGWTDLISYDVFPAVNQCIQLRYPKNEGNTFLLITLYLLHHYSVLNPEHENAVYTLGTDITIFRSLPFSSSFLDIIYLLINTHLILQFDVVCTVHHPIICI